MNILWNGVTVKVLNTLAEDAAVGCEAGYVLVPAHMFEP